MSHLTITNLTPHAVTIIRPNGQRTEYPPCDPERLPRAVEAPNPGGVGSMLLIYDDTQGSYANSQALADTGLVDRVAYCGVEGLPPLTLGASIAFGVTEFHIVSIVTVIGAIAAGRPTADLLVPMGQVRDASGRVVGATGLASADCLLGPAAEALHRKWRR